MTDEQFLQQLREAFAVEAAEHVQAMTSGLLELEKAPEPARRMELVETIFRDAHSLKGAARAANHGEIESVCQALESVFSQWKRSDAPVAPETFDLLNRAVDLVGRLLAQSDASGSDQVAEVVRELGGVSSVARAKGIVEPVVLEAAETPAAPLVQTAPVTRESEAPAAPEPEVASPSETVRVPMVKMDLLLRRAEELIAVKLSTRRNAAELRGLGSELEAWRKEWARVRSMIRGGLANQSPAALSQIADFFERNQSFIAATERRLAALVGVAVHDERSTAMLIDELLDDAKRLLMLPFATLLDLFPKIVRDLARAEGKEVSLSIQGREVEIDKRILQEMKDPLIHLARNSIDHGIELPAKREAARKPRTGRLTLAVSQLEGSKVEILARDDGCGIDIDKVKASAVRAGALTEESAATLDEDAALALIFSSGLSTSPIVTEISGRGLGMSIVREKVEKLGGAIAIETTRGAGTTFRIVLPVTLATLKGILVSVSGQTFVIPTAKVERITRVRRDDIRTVENRETIALDGHAIAFARLQEALELPPNAEAESFVEIVVLGSAERRIAFAVDEVQSEQEILVKSIGKPLQGVRNVAGATFLASGVPAIILNTSDLLKTAVRISTTGGRRLSNPAESSKPKRKRQVLVVDDSVTSRILLKNILETASYQVTTAIDGVDAMTALRSGAFDVLVSDIEMPRMDGFDLTAKVRADAKLAELPVVLVTALGSREHQERGIDVGANAYIIKSNFDQSNLLETIRRLL